MMHHSRQPGLLHPSEVDEPYEQQCTGLAAVWCPNCGDCDCERSATGERTEPSMICALHGDGSVHGEPGAAEAQQSSHCAGDCPCRNRERRMAAQLKAVTSALESLRAKLAELSRPRQS